MATIDIAGRAIPICTGPIRVTVEALLADTPLATAYAPVAARIARGRRTAGQAASRPSPRDA